MSVSKAKTQVPVKIIENPVASISFTPANSYEIIENTHGDWSENDNGEQYFAYYIPKFEPGDVLTVIGKDGSSVAYTYEDESWTFISENANKIDSSELNRNDQGNRWTIGGENYFTIEYMGAETQVPVKIIENPIASISFTPANPYEIIENTHGDWSENDNGEKYFKYYVPEFYQGDVLTVTNNDGTSVDYTFNNEEYGFISVDGDKIKNYSVSRSSNQYCYTL